MTAVEDEQWLSQRIIVSPEIVVQKVDDELVLLDLTSEAYFGLDAIGTRIWELLQAQYDLEAVFEVLLREYDISEELLATQLPALLKDLVREGLISLVPANV